MESGSVNILSKWMRWCLESIFGAGCVIVATLPFTLKRYFLWYFGQDEQFYRFVLIMLLLCGICALLILRQLVAMFKSINKGNPFIYENAKCLKVISICCFIISVLFFLKCIFYLTFLTIVVSFMFVIAGFCAFIFAALFKQAVDYKSENDLTI